MPLLDRVIDYLEKAYKQPLPTSHPPKDDLALALSAWTMLLLGIAIAIGKACSH
jgi:hypothetical protein